MGPSQALRTQALQKARTRWQQLVSNSWGYRAPCWASGFNVLPPTVPGTSSSTPAPTPNQHGVGSQGGQTQPSLPGLPPQAWREGPHPLSSGMGKGGLWMDFLRQSAELEDQRN